MSGQIWFTSDTHAYHRNISGASVSKWKDGYRNFRDEFHMTDYIVDQINKCVKEDDTLYHCGDWSFGGKERIWEFRNRIVCKTIHLCLGNHDEHIRRNMTIPIRNTIGNDYFTPQSLFTSVQDVKTVKHGETTFFLSHYAHRTWYGHTKSIIHLYGHSHGSLPSYGKSMDVGVDNAKLILGEYRPFHINEVMSLMKKREIEFPDKHDLNSNIN